MRILLGILFMGVFGCSKKACPPVPLERHFKAGEYACIRAEHNDDWSDKNYIGCGYLYFHK